MEIQEIQPKGKTPGGEDQFLHPGCTLFVATDIDVFSIYPHSPLVQKDHVLAQGAKVQKHGSAMFGQARVTVRHWRTSWFGLSFHTKE